MLREQEAAQVLVGDPEADPQEVELLLALGMRSLLIVPVVSQGETLGIVEAYSDNGAAVDQDPDQPRADHLEPVRLDDAGGLPVRGRPVALGRLLAEEHLLQQEEVERDDQRRQYTDER